MLEQGPHQLSVGIRAGGYTHPGNHVALFLRPELGYRATARQGPFLELTVGPGYQDRFVSGVVYVEDTERFSLGKSRRGFAPAAGAGVGWDLSDAVPLRITLRAEGWLVTPINRGWRAGVAGSIGLTWISKARSGGAP